MTEELMYPLTFTLSHAGERGIILILRQAQDEGLGLDAGPGIRGAEESNMSADSAPHPLRYSGNISPEPPASFGKSLNLGRPSFMWRTVS